MFIVFNQLEPPEPTQILDLYPCIIMYIEITIGLGSSTSPNVWSIRCAIIDCELSNDGVAITGSYLGKVPFSNVQQVTKSGRRNSGHYRIRLVYS